MYTVVLDMAHFNPFQSDTVIDINEEVLWQIVKTQMAQNILRHFISVCTVYKVKNSGTEMY